MSGAASWHADVEMPMRDDVLLRADLWRPREPAPAVVFRTPYDRRALTSDVLKPMDCVLAGYAAVTQDTRGRFGSDGKWTPIMWDQEALDTYDTVEWVARQEWCDGRVILAGTSYGGILSFLGAATRPPSLAGVAAAMVTTGSRDRRELGGAMRLEQVFSWLIYMAADWLARHPEQADAQTVSTLQSLFADPAAALTALPLVDGPMSSLAGFPLDIPALLRGEISTTPEWLATDIDVPVFVSTGWYDVFCSATVDAFRDALAERPDLPHRLVVGPWAHTGPLPHLVGELNFGVIASASAAALPGRQLDFFRNATVATPPEPQHQVTYFLMGADRWETAEAWPPPTAAPRVLHLHPGARPAGSTGSLEDTPSRLEGVDTYRYDPLSAVPSRGGRVIHLGRSTPGPIDLSWQLAREDVLTYQTAPVADAVDVVGRVTAELRVEVDQPDADIVVRLVDCWPDSRVYPVAEGMTRLKARSDAHAPVPVRPGEVVQVEVELGYTAQRFRPGHRLGLLVTSSAFPHADRNLNSLESSVTSSDARTVTVGLHADGSTLTVDVIRAEGDR